MTSSSAPKARLHLHGDGPGPEYFGVSVERDGDVLLWRETRELNDRADMLDTVEALQSHAELVRDGPPFSDVPFAWLELLLEGARPMWLVELELVHAAGAGDVARVRALLDGERVEGQAPSLAQPKRSSYSALERALDGKAPLDLVRLLLARGSVAHFRSGLAGVLVRVADRADAVDVVRAFLDAGLDVPSDGAFFAHVKTLAVAQALVDAGARIRGARINPLWSCCGLPESAPLVRLYADAGAPVDDVDTRGNTILLGAANHADVAMVKELLLLGADPHPLPNKSGQTPLSMAQARVNDVRLGDAAKKIIALLR